jgi:hypothetical protein
MGERLGVSLRARGRVPSFLFLYYLLPHASSERWQVRIQSFCLFSRATFCTTPEATFLLTSQLGSLFEFQTAFFTVAPKQP